VAPQDSGTNRYREAEQTLWSQYELAPTERFVEVGAPPVRIRILEVGSGAPVLFAHGTAGSGPAFASLIHELPSLRCIVFDRPGFALSSPIRYSADSFGTTVAELQGHVLDALGIPAVDVVGHSSAGSSRFASLSTTRRGSDVLCCWVGGRWLMPPECLPSSA
jgi:hypothetical protein